MIAINNIDIKVLVDKSMFFLCWITNIYFLFTETQNLVMEFIKSAQRDFVNDWNALFTELPPEVVTNIQRIFS